MIQGIEQQAECYGITERMSRQFAYACASALIEPHS